MSSRTLAFTLAFLTLPACFNPTGNDPVTRQDALEVWTGPGLDRCTEDADHLIIQITDRDTVAKLCKDTSDRVDGCFIHKLGYPGYKPLPTIVFDIDYEPRSRLLAHELTHWLYECSGLGSSNDNHAEKLFQDTVVAILAH